MILRFNQQYHSVKRPAAAAMKMQKSAFFRGAAASWTGHPTGRTRGFNRSLIIRDPALLNLSDGGLVQIAVLNDSKKFFIQLQAVAVNHVLRDIRGFTVHQQFQRDWDRGNAHEFFLCAHAAGQQHR